jgi:hypothetical protein
MLDPATRLSVRVTLLPPPGSSPRASILVTFAKAVAATSPGVRKYSVSMADPPVTVSADVSSSAANTESLRPLPPLKLSLPAPAMKDTAVPLLMALASTVSLPAPPRIQKKPVLVPATRLFVRVTSLPPVLRTRPSIFVTLAKSAAETAPAVAKSTVSIPDPPWTVSAAVRSAKT